MIPSIVLTSNNYQFRRQDKLMIVEQSGQQSVQLWYPYECAEAIIPHAPLCVNINTCNQLWHSCTDTTDSQTLTHTYVKSSCWMRDVGSNGMVK